MGSTGIGDEVSKGICQHGNEPACTLQKFCEEINPLTGREALVYRVLIRREASAKGYWSLELRDGARATRVAAAPDGATTLSAARLDARR